MSKQFDGLPVWAAEGNIHAECTPQEFKESNIYGTGLSVRYFVWPLWAYFCINWSDAEPFDAGNAYIGRLKWDACLDFIAGGTHYCGIRDIERHTQVLTYIYRVIYPRIPENDGELESGTEIREPGWCNDCRMWHASLLLENTEGKIRLIGCPAMPVDTVRPMASPTPQELCGLPSKVDPECMLKVRVTATPPHEPPRSYYAEATLIAENIEASQMPKGSLLPKVDPERRPAPIKYTVPAGITWQLPSRLAYLPGTGCVHASWQAYSDAMGETARWCEDCGALGEVE